MKEDFLHYLWQYQLFSGQNLRTQSGHTISVIKPGIHNLLAGPDFFNAQVRIDEQLWAGNVEIHVRSSDWYVHGHEKDTNYDTIILHVVWEKDVEIYYKNNTLIPTLELKEIIDGVVFRNYQKLFSKSKRWINCENGISNIDKFQLSKWFEKLFIERLEQKTLLSEELLDDSKMDWERVLFIMLARNFGLNVNGEAFFNFAKRLDFSVIKKNQHDIQHLEALLFGFAGFLDSEEIEDQYYLALKKKYMFLKAKYQIDQYDFQFQFFRLRPANFPTVRLSQLAMLYATHRSLFTELMEISDLNRMYDVFRISVSDYWKTHYSFTSRSKKSNKRFTKDFVDLLIINTIIPLKFTYLKKIGKFNIEEFLTLLTQMKSEKNAIISKFATLGIFAGNAFDSQALLHLKKEYCVQQKCLECNIGYIILNNSQ